MSNQLQTCGTEDSVRVRVEDYLTPVLFARDGEEATRYCAMLEDIDIPALVADHTDTPARGLGVPVLVPRSLQERASEILASFGMVESDDEFDDGEYSDDEEDDDDDLSDDDDEDDDEDDEFLDDDLDNK